MFTGFASENTPAIQVWDFSAVFASGSAVRSAALTNDCAPIQFFKTGGSASGGINVYLPSAPVEGKPVRIINAKYGSSNQKILVYAPDARGIGSSAIAYTVGAGQQITLVYTLTSISMPSGGNISTGWICLDQGPTSSINPYSICFGYDTQATGLASGVFGGQVNTASNVNAAVVGGDNNTASQTGSLVAGGTSNTASGSYSAVIGGNGAVANNNGAVVLGGTNCATTGIYGAAIAGNQTVANGSNSCVAGGSQGTSRSITGNFVFSASDAPIQNNSGRQQLATLLLGRQTTDATATVLTSNTSAAGTTNQVILPNNSAYTFQGTCIANVTAGGTTSGWKFEGVIKRGATAASTTLVAAVTPTVIAQDAGAAAWVLAITADTTNGGIAVTVTGAAATTIRWVVQIETTEVTF